MKLTVDQVKHVAKLANLPLDSKEEEKSSEQLSKILEYAEQLNQVDTRGVEPTFNVTELDSVTRNDVTAVGLSQEPALSNATESKDGLYVTKGVFDE